MSGSSVPVDRPPSTPRLEVFISYHAMDSRAHENFALPLKYRLEAELSAIKATVICYETDEKYRLSSDYQRDIDKDLAKQPIFVPILTIGWLESEHCQLEYAGFLKSYGLSETDRPEKCSERAKRVRMIPLRSDKVSLDILKNHSSHAARTLFRGTYFTEPFPSDHEIRMRGTSDVWDRWVASLAEQILTLHAGNWPDLSWQKKKKRRRKQRDDDPPHPPRVQDPPADTLDLLGIVRQRVDALGSPGDSAPSWLAEVSFDPSAWTGSDAQFLLLDMLLAKVHAGDSDVRPWFEGVLRDMGASPQGARP